MGNNVENRVVEMRFDNAQFEEGVKTSLSTIDRLKQSLKFEKTGESLSGLSREVKSFNMNPIEKALTNISGRFTTFGIIGMRVLQNLTDSAMRLGHRLVSSITDPLIQGGIQRAMDTAQAKFMYEGLNLKTSWEEISGAIRNAVDGTAYGFDEAAKAAAQLGASGVSSASEMERHLLAIGGTAAMTGSSFAEISDIFTSVAGQGKLMAYQLNQLSFRGLNAAAILGQQLGKTEAEIRDMVHDGEIDFKTFSDAMDKAFGEHAKDANKTFTGALANMKAALKRIGEEIASPSLEHFRDLFNSIKGAIEKVHDALGRNGTGLLGTIAKIIGYVTKGLANFIDKLDFSWLKGAADTVSNVLLGIIGLAVKAKDAFIKMLPKSLGDKFKNLGKTIYDWSVTFRNLHAPKGLLKDLGLIEKTAKKAQKPLYDVAKLAEKVINGDYGNGQKRIDELHKIDVSYAKVQNRVNEVLGVSKRHKETQEDLAAEERRRNKLLKEQAKATGNVADNTKRLTNEETSLDKLANIIGGMVSIIKTAASFVKALWNVIVKPAVKTFLGVILDLGSKIGKKLIDISKNAEKTKTFEARLKSIKDSVVAIAGKLGSIAKSITKFKPISKTFELISKAITKVISGVTALPGKFKTFSDKVSKLPGVVQLTKTLTKLADDIKSKVLDGIKSLGDAFGSLNFDSIKGFNGSVLYDGIDFIATSLNNLIKLIMDGAEQVKNFISAFKIKIPNPFKAITDNVNSLKDAFNNVSADSGNATDGIKKFFDTFTDNAGKVYENSKGIGTNLIKGLLDAFSKFSGEKLLGIIKTSASIYAIFKFVDLLKSLRGGIDSVKAIPKKIGGVFDALSSAITEHEKKINAEVVYTLAKSILMIASSLLILSGIDSHQLTNIAVSMGVVIGAVALLVRSIGLLPQKAKVSDAEKAMGEVGKSLSDTIKNFGSVVGAAITRSMKSFGLAATIIAFAFAVSILVKTFSTLASAKTSMADAKWAAEQMGGIVLALVAAVGALNFIGNMVTVGTAATLIALSLSLKIIAEVMKTVGSIDSGQYEQGMAGIIGMSLAIAALAAVAGNAKALPTMALGMILMAAALTVMIVPLKAMSKIPFGTILTSILEMAGAFVVLTAFAEYAQTLGAGAVNLVIMGGALAIIAGALALLAPVADKTTGALISLIIAIGAMAIGAAIAEALSAGLLALTGAMLGMSVSFLMFGAGAALFGVAVEKIGQGLSLIGQGFVDLANGVVESLKTVSENKDTIAQGLSDTISALAKSIHNSRHDLVNGFADLFTAMAEAVTIATPKIVTAIGQFLLAVMVSLTKGLGILADVAVAGIVTAINELSRAVVDNTPALMEACKNALLSLQYFIVSAITEMVNSFLGPLSGVIPQLKSVYEGWNQMSKDSLAAIENSMSYEKGKEATSKYLGGQIDGVNEKEGDLSDTMKGAVAKALTGGKEEAQGVVAGMISDPIDTEMDAASEKASAGVDELTQNMFSTMSPEEIKEYFKGLGINIPEGLIEGLQNGSMSFTDVMQELASDGNNSFTGFLGINSPSTVFMRHGADIIDGLVQGLTSNMAKVMKPITEIAQKLSGSMKGKGSGFAAAGTQMMNALKQSISSATSGVRAAAMNVINNASKAIKSKLSDFRATGKNLMSNMSKGINSMASSIKSAVTKIVSRAKSAADGYKGSFRSIGGDLMSGLKSGIMSKVSDIASAAASAVKKAIAAARAAAKSKSPSKEFMWIGQDLDAGMVIGINNFSKKVSKAASNMSISAIDNAKKALTGISSIIDPNAQPVITPVVDMSGVYATAKDIDDLFGASSIGLGGNLGAITNMMNNRQNGSDNSDIISALHELNNGLKTMPRNNYNIGGVTYDDGSNISSAVSSLVRVLRMEGRV